MSDNDNIASRTRNSASETSGLNDYGDSSRSLASTSSNAQLPQTFTLQELQVHIAEAVRDALQADELRRLTQNSVSPLPGMMMSTPMPSTTPRAQQSTTSSANQSAKQIFEPDLESIPVNQYGSTTTEMMATIKSNIVTTSTTDNKKRIIALHSVLRSAKLLTLLQKTRTRPIITPNNKYGFIPRGYDAMNNSIIDSDDIFQYQHDFDRLFTIILTFFGESLHYLCTDDIENTDGIAMHDHVMVHIHGRLLKDTDRARKQLFELFSINPAKNLVVELERMGSLIRDYEYAQDAPMTEKQKHDLLATHMYKDQRIHVNTAMTTAKAMKLSYVDTIERVIEMYNDLPEKVSTIKMAAITTTAPDTQQFCRNWQTGTCRHGDKCKYKHEKDPSFKPAPGKQEALKQHEDKKKSKAPYGSSNRRSQAPRDFSNVRLDAQHSKMVGPPRGVPSAYNSQGYSSRQRETIKLLVPMETLHLLNTAPRAIAPAPYSSWGTSQMYDYMTRPDDQPSFVQLNVFRIQPAESKYIEEYGSPPREETMFSTEDTPHSPRLISTYQTNRANRDHLKELRFYPQLNKIVAHYYDHQFGYSPDNPKPADNSLCYVIWVTQRENVLPIDTDRRIPILSILGWIHSYPYLASLNHVQQDLINPDVNLMRILYIIGKNCLQAHAIQPNTQNPNIESTLDQFCNFTTANFRCFSDQSDGCYFSQHSCISDYFEDLIFIAKTEGLSDNSKCLFYVAVLYDFMAFVSESLSRPIPHHAYDSISLHRDHLQDEISACHGIFGDSHLINAFRAAVHQTPPLLARDTVPLDTPHRQPRFDLSDGPGNTIGKRPRLSFENEAAANEQPSEDSAVNRSTAQPADVYATNRSTSFFCDLDNILHKYTVQVVDLTADTPPRKPSSSASTFATPNGPRFTSQFSPTSDAVTPPFVPATPVCIDTVHKSQTPDHLRVFNVSSLKRLDNSSVVIFDTGASRSGTGHPRLLDELQPCEPVTVQGAFGPPVHPKLKGNLGPLGLDTIVIDGMPDTLVSISQVCAGGSTGVKHVAIFDSEGVRIFNQQSIVDYLTAINLHGNEILRGSNRNGLYIQDSLPRKTNHLLVATHTTASLYDHIHAVTGHPGHQGMEWHRTHSDNAQYSTTDAKAVRQICAACVKGGMRQTPTDHRRIHRAKPTKPGQQFCIDAYSHSTTSAVGNNYADLFVDLATHLVHPVFTRDRSADELCTKAGILMDRHPEWRHTEADPNFPRLLQPRFIRADSEKSYTSHQFHAFAAHRNYKLEHTPPRDKHANGVAESAVGVIALKANVAMLAPTPHVPKTYWDHAVQYACDTQSFCYHSALGTSPYTYVTGANINIKYLQAFWTACWVYVPLKNVWARSA